MSNLLYIVILAICGALCGIVGVIGESCALTLRTVWAAALQGMLFGAFTTLIIDASLGTQFSGIAVGVGAIVATLRMKLLVPVCNIALKALYDVLFAIIQHFTDKK